MIDRFDLSYVARAFLQVLHWQIVPDSQKINNRRRKPPKGSENFNPLFQPQLLIRQKQIKCCQM